MALIEHDLFRGRIDKVQMAVDRMKTFEPPEGYYLAYSGGKDSDTILALAKMAGVKFDAHYHLTTVDPPELVYHVRKHPEVKIERPTMTMWQLIRKKGILPTRWIRYCCDILKETGGAGRFVITGIRAEESAKRAKRQMVHSCYKDKHKKYLHPIIDWTTEDIWQFIRECNLPYCKLYDVGWRRIGCILCPLAGNKERMRALKEYPKIAEAYHKALLRSYKKDGSKFSSAEEMWQWWLSGKGKSEDGGLFT